MINFMSITLVLKQVADPNINVASSFLARKFPQKRLFTVHKSMQVFELQVRKLHIDQAYLFWRNFNQFTVYMLY